MGPSGTGKTTLALGLSRALNLPYITTSAKNVWPKYGIKKHAEAFELNELMFADYQKAIVRDRSRLIRNVEYVTDRSPVDNLVYTMDFLARKQHMVPYIDEIKGMVHTQLGRYVDLLIYLPFTNKISLEDDGKRVTSHYYQRTITGLFNVVLGDILEGEIRALKIPVLTYVSRNIDTKIEQVVKFIRNAESE